MKHSLNEILKDFNPTEPTMDEKQRLTANVTICVPVEVKEKFDRLQIKSNRRFGKKAREALLALIELAEKIPA